MKKNGKEPIASMEGIVCCVVPSSCIGSGETVGVAPGIKCCHRRMSWRTLGVTFLKLLWEKDRRNMPRFAGLL